MTTRTSTMTATATAPIESKAELAKLLAKAHTGDMRETLRTEMAAGGAEESTYPIAPVVLSVSAMLYCAYDLAGQVAGGELSLGFLGALFLFTLVFVDVASGFLHLILDNPFFLDPNNWAQGALEEFAKGFQEHHLDTTLICRMSLMTHLTPMGVPVFLVALWGMLCGAQCASAFSLFVGIDLILMQMAHRWSHLKSEERPAFAVFMQSTGVLLTSNQHLKHHKAPYATQFCILTGWANPVLNKLVTVVSPTNPNYLFVFLGWALSGHFGLAYLGY